MRNTPILEVGTPFEQRVDRAVAAWASRERAPDRLVSGVAFFAVHLWWFGARQHARSGDGARRQSV